MNKTAVQNALDALKACLEEIGPEHDGVDFEGECPACHVAKQARESIAALEAVIAQPVESVNATGYVQVIACSSKLQALVVQWYTARLPSEGQAWVDLLNYVNGLTELQHARSYAQGVLARPAAPQEPAAPGWFPISQAPKDGTAFRAFAIELIDLDFNPGGSVECAWDGEAFIGCVWNGQQDVWYGTPINPTLFQPLPPAPGEPT